MEGFGKVNKRNYSHYENNLSRIKLNYKYFLNNQIFPLIFVNKKPKYHDLSTKKVGILNIEQSTLNNDK